ncbi:cell cycle protein GpsB [Intestinibaculum porci]|uniref:Cell cycle protein GpsB n=1 Tax=Intestinibaculum porci TaxID=2487118 RepID=A0A3G9JM07_9FIRM|nr:cell division regulator GpsB [Intestinibaculum porci]BBH26043.1 cell cycle protein GpsB [Intestinibaculum porci]
MENKIKLSPKKILNKQFQIDFKGYNANEVDYFLDLIVADYENFAAMLNESYDEIESLQRENAALKQKISSLEAGAPTQNAQNLEAKMAGNVDLLKRLSQLEKEVYSNKKND